MRSVIINFLKSIVIALRRSYRESAAAQWRLRSAYTTGCCAVYRILRIICAKMRRI